MQPRTKNSFNFELDIDEATLRTTLGDYGYTNGEITSNLQGLFKEVLINLLVRAPRVAPETLARHGFKSLEAFDNFLNDSSIIDILKTKVQRPQERLSESLLSRLQSAYENALKHQQEFHGSENALATLFDIFEFIRNTSDKDLSIMEKYFKSHNEYDAYLKGSSFPQFKADLNTMPPLAFEYKYQGCFSGMLENIIAPILQTEEFFRLLDKKQSHQEFKNRSDTNEKKGSAELEKLVPATEKWQAIKARYQPMMEKIGVDRIFKNLQDTLEKHYQNNPATIKVNNQDLVLPLSFKDFNAFADTHQLDSKAKAEALRAYYQHPAHSAYRYLSKPNLWLSPKVSNVSANPTAPNERWSSFEIYQPLIVMLYLAASDIYMAPTNNYNLETRLNYFIKTLSQLARLHNCNKGYDDLEADKPASDSHVKRHLFQSVQGHALFDSTLSPNATAALSGNSSGIFSHQNHSDEVKYYVPGGDIPPPPPPEDEEPPPAPSSS